MNGKIFGNSLVKAGFVTFALALGLAACGDGESSNGPSNNHEGANVSSVESEDDLPSCTENREGFVRFIDGTKEGFVCKDRRWDHYDMIADVEENLPGCTGSREGLSAFLYEEDRELNCVEGSWDVVGEVASSSSSEKGDSSSSREKDGSSSSVAPNSSSGVILSDSEGSSGSVASSCSEEPSCSTESSSSDGFSSSSAKSSSSSVASSSSAVVSSSSVTSSSSVASSSSTSVIPGTDPGSPSSSSEKDDSSSSVAPSSSSVILSSSSEESSSSVANSSSAKSSSSVASSSSEKSSSSVASSSSAKSSSSSVISGSSSSVIPSEVEGSSSSSKANWAYLNPNIDYGTMTDTRDGQAYKTFTIGTQTWMAENLNYDPGNVSSMDSYAWSGCYNNESSNCAKYGRLYTWEVAMNNASCAYGKTCDASLNPTNPVRGVCPQGWHLPSHREFEELINYIDPSFRYDHITNASSSTAGQYLKSLSGWNSSGNGSDAYGFSALPGGNRDGDGDFYNAGDGAYFWSSGEYNSSYAFLLYLNYSREDASLRYGNYKYKARSVRCLKD